MNTVNEVFNFRRFWAYAMRSWSLYAKKYLVHAGIFAGIMVLLMVFVATVNRPVLDERDLLEITPWYVIFILTFFATFPMVVMKPLKSRHALTMENTIPVSITEKWLFVLLNTTVVAAILCATGLALTLLTGVSIAGTEPFAQYIGGAMNDTPWQIYLIFTFMLLMLQAGVMFAGTQERRNHRVSVLLLGATVLAAVLVFVGLPIWLSDELPGPNWGPMFFFSDAYVVSGPTAVHYYGGESVLDEDARTRLVWIAGSATTLLFWLAAWFNFRERSIK